MENKNKNRLFLFWNTDLEKGWYIGRIYRLIYTSFPNELSPIFTDINIEANTFEVEQTPTLRLQDNAAIVHVPSQLQYQTTEDRKLLQFYFHGNCVVICQEAVPWCVPNHDCAWSTQGSGEILAHVRKSVFISWWRHGCLLKFTSWMCQSVSHSVTVVKKGRSTVITRWLTSSSQNKGTKL